MSTFRPSTNFPCANCGAHLVVDGSTPAPTCAYCNTQTMLPDEIWEHFHPKPPPQPRVVIATAPEAKPRFSPLVLALLIGIPAVIPVVVGIVIAVASGAAQTAVSSTTSPSNANPLAVAGEACGGRTAACAKDKKAMLHCDANGKLVVEMTCKGPNACQVATDGRKISCDTKYADLDDPCVGDDSACATDHKAELTCVKNRFVVRATCKGVDGCTVDGHTLSCDDHVADVGDPCFGAERTACSSDHKFLLTCTAQRFAVAEKCKGRGGCRVKKIVGTGNTSMDCAR